MTAAAPAAPMQAWLNPLSGFIRERLGLHFPEEHWNDLRRNFLKAVDSFGYTDPAACLQWLMQPDLPAKELHKLAGFLTIGETYFFREKNYFEPMARHIFSDVIERKRACGQKQLRVWSAACSTGEEPYSIAILLNAMLPDIRDWSIRILATDINPVFLERARQAVYRPWSFRGTPDWVRQRYFDSEGESHTIRPEIQKQVAFDFLNLADDVYPSLSTQTQAMDVIFCRNVLIYFSQQQARNVIGRLQDSLVEQGWLVLSPTETVYVTDPALHRQYVCNSILYQKDTTRPATRRHTSEESPSAFRPARSVRKPKPFRAPLKTRVAPKKPIKNVPPPAEKTEPDEPSSLNRQVEALYEKGLHRDTVDLIIRHLDGQAATGRTAFLLARAQANTGNLDDALQNALNAAESDKLAPEHHYLLAMIQLEKNAPDEARRSLNRVIYLDEEHIMAFFSMGHLAVRQQMPDSAEKYFRHALRLLEKQPDDRPVPEGEGMTAERLKELILTAMEELS